VKRHVFQVLNQLLQVDYLNDFRDLIWDSSYTNLKTIVIKFRRELNPTIVDAVATMTAGRPDDLDLGIVMGFAMGFSGV
jgi:hypothetical protein